MNDSVPEPVRQWLLDVFTHCLESGEGHADRFNAGLAVACSHPSDADVLLQVSLSRRFPEIPSDKEVSGVTEVMREMAEAVEGDVTVEQENEGPLRVEGRNSQHHYVFRLVMRQPGYQQGGLL